MGSSGKMTSRDNLSSSACDSVISIRRMPSDIAPDTNYSALGILGSHELRAGVWMICIRVGDGDSYMNGELGFETSLAESRTVRLALALGIIGALLGLCIVFLQILQVEVVAERGYETLQYMARVSNVIGMASGAFMTAAFVGVMRKHLSPLGFLFVAVYAIQWIVHYAFQYLLSLLFSLGLVNVYPFLSAMTSTFLISVLSYALWTIRAVAANKTSLLAIVVLRPLIPWGFLIYYVYWVPGLAELAGWIGYAFYYIPSIVMSFLLGLAYLVFFLKEYLQWQVI